MVIGPYIRAILQVLDVKLNYFSPEDISAIVWALSQMQYTSGTELLNRLCKVAENKMSEFSIYTLTSFLRGLSLLEHNGIPSMNRKALKEIENKIDEYDLYTLSRVVWALILLSQHPHGKVLFLILHLNYLTKNR